MVYRWLVTVTLAIFLMTPFVSYAGLQEGIDAFERGDYAYAATQLKRAAKRGNADAQLRLGMMYMSGKGVKKNSSIAARYLKKSADQGNDKAITALKLLNAAPPTNAQPRTNAKLPNKQKSTVQKKPRKTAKQKTRKQTSTQTANTALDKLKQRAENGDGNAQLKLAQTYGERKGNRIYAKKALKWYIKAARQKISQAEYELGMFYSDGYAEPMNMIKTKIWLQKAADQGHNPAQTELNKIVKDENELRNYMDTADVELSLWTVEKMAETGYAPVQYLLGMMYTRGYISKDFSVGQNYKKGMYWYKQASDNGHADATFNLSLMYAKGRGVRKNKTMFINYLRKSAKLGSARAQKVMKDMGIKRG